MNGLPTSWAAASSGGGRFAVAGRVTASWLFRGCPSGARNQRPGEVFCSSVLCSDRSGGQRLMPMLLPSVYRIGSSSVSTRN